MEKRGSGFQKITERTSELRLFSEDRMPTFESDSSSFFTTVYSVLYGRSEEDFQRVINQESTPKEEDTTQKTGNTTQKPISDTAQKIIDLLSEDPYLTRLDIALRLSLTTRWSKVSSEPFTEEGIPYSCRRPKERSLESFNQEIALF